MTTNLLLQQCDHWVTKAGIYESQRLYVLQGKAERMIQTLKEYRYGENSWEQDFAEKMKTELRKTILQLLEVLAEFDSEAKENESIRGKLQEEVQKLRRAAGGGPKGYYLLCLAQKLEEAAKGVLLGEEDYLQLLTAAEEVCCEEAKECAEE